MEAKLNSKKVSALWCEIIFFGGAEVSTGRTGRTFDLVFSLTQ
jgi:hypothetical protein